MLWKQIGVQMLPAPRHLTGSHLRQTLLVTLGTHKQGRCPAQAHIPGTHKQGRCPTSTHCDLSPPTLASCMLVLSSEATDCSLLEEFRLEASQAPRAFRGGIGFGPRAMAAEGKRKRRVSSSGVAQHATFPGLHPLQLEIIHSCLTCLGEGTPNPIGLPPHHRLLWEDWSYLTLR